MVTVGASDSGIARGTSLRVSLVGVFAGRVIVSFVLARQVAVSPLLNNRTRTGMSSSDRVIFVFSSNVALIKYLLFSGGGCWSALLSDG